MNRTTAAILTVIASLTCGSTTSGAPGAVPRSPGDRPVAGPEDQIPEVLEVLKPRRLAIQLLDGTRVSGPWLGFDAEGLLFEGGRVPWVSVSPADRLRVGRDLIRVAGGETAAAWSLLLVALEVSESGEMVGRARARLKQVAGEDAPKALETVQAGVDSIREARRSEAASRDAIAIRRQRPHLVTVPTGGSAIPARRPGRLPVEVDADRGGLRSLVEVEIEGLGLHLVPTTHTIAAGPDSLELAAALGVELDQFLEDCRARLGGAMGTPLPGGGVALLATSDLDDARLLAARHRIDWPEGETSLVVPRPEGWIAILPPLDRSCIERWAPLMADGTAEDACRRVEMARIAARIAVLEAGMGKVPAWMVDGFAEAAAQRLVSTAPLEKSERAAAVHRLRTGGRPEVIFAADSGDSTWAPDGDAHRLAYLMVTRLLETNPALFAGIVADLAAGATVDEAFRRRTGMTRGAWFEDTVDWHRTND